MEKRRAGSLAHDQLTPKASDRIHKRPRLLFEASRPSNNSSAASPQPSSNGANSSTTARSILFDASSRRNLTTKEADDDSLLAAATQHYAKDDNDQPRIDTKDGLKSPASKISSLFGKAVQNIQRTPSRPSVTNFLDNFSPYAKTPSTPFSPSLADPDQWHEAPLNGEWFDFSIYTQVELEGQPRMDLTYDDTTALSRNGTTCPPSLSSAQVYHRFPPSITSSMNSRKQVSKQDWKSAFRSLYFRWKGLDRDSYFYMVTTSQTTLFRKRIENDGRMVCEVTLSKCRFCDTLRQRHGVKLYLAVKWNNHAKGTEWDEKLVQARKKLNVSPATKAELLALNNAPTVGADITVHTGNTKAGSSSLPPLFATGQDDCDAVYECYMNMAPVDTVLVCRDGAFLHSTLERLTSSTRQQSLKGPILPCAIASLCQAAAHIATQSSNGEAYWLVTATSQESTLMIAWDKARPEIVAYKKR